MNNKDLRKRFQLYSELLQLHGSNENLAKALGGASYRIGQMPEPVVELDKTELKKQFRSDIVKLIAEVAETGVMEELEGMIQLTPSGLFEMMRIKGLGGKKLAVIWKSAGIDNIDKLLQACKKGTISELQGFGAKTEQNIITSIEELRSSEKFFHYAHVADDASAGLTLFQQEFQEENSSLCGDIRRKANTVESIEIITTVDSKRFNDNETLTKYFIVKEFSSEKTFGHTINELPFIIYHCSSSEFHLELFKKTGNSSHVKKILEKVSNAEFKSEDDIYKASGFNYIVPELREDVAEWNYLKSKNSLVELTDIKGVVHNHTTYSDGIDTLRDFIQACIRKKFEYCVISDHSKNAHYAGGLKEDKVLKQQEEIDALNKEFAPFRIFKSIECDILISGELDYGNDFLKNFDLVIVSIHQLLKMDEERATARLIKAIENPYTTILGHMTGRQLLIRQGYPVDFKKVIDACAANNVVIEINANPYRLDVDWTHIPYIMEKGIKISINPDAHSISEIDNIRWGVESARKGGLTKEMTWNAQGLADIEKWLAKKKPVG